MAKFAIKSDNRKQNLLLPPSLDELVRVTYNEEAPLEEIILWVSDNSKDYVLTKPIHGSQVLIRGSKEEVLRAQHPKLIGGSYFKIKCKENYELIRELMSFGTELVVNEPAL